MRRRKAGYGSKSVPGPLPRAHETLDHRLTGIDEQAASLGGGLAERSLLDGLDARPRIAERRRDGRVSPR